MLVEPDIMRRIQSGQLSQLSAANVRLCTKLVHSRREIAALRVRVAYLEGLLSAAGITYEKEPTDGQLD